MTAIRLVGVPIEHLDAELLAAPLASRRAFGASLVALSPAMSGATAPLWRETERELLQRFPGLSVDELNARRDQQWFGALPRGFAPVGLADLLGHAARQVVNADAGSARPIRQGPRSEVDQRRLWRWLSFSLPADLLLACIGASGQSLDFVSRALKARLESDGLAEMHLHLKAAMSFGDLWASLMSVLADNDAGPQMLQGVGADWNDGRALAPMLLQCALARLLLAAFLAGAYGGATSFRDYVARVALPGLGRQLGGLPAATLWRTAADLARGEPAGAASFAALRHYYALLIGRRRWPPPARVAMDPLGHWFPEQTDAHSDFRFTAAACAYLRGAGAADDLFARLFWQTVRGRVAFYRHIVQRPMVPGLQWFIRNYARLSAPRRALPLRAYVQHACRLAGPGLRSLEGRLSPDDRFLDLHRNFVALERLAATVPAEFGIVFHFSRTRGGGAEAGLPAAWGTGGHDDPRARRYNPSGYRFSGYYRSQRSGAVGLATLLHSYPRSLELVRGVDLCTDELGVPLWVLKPVVEHVLRAGRHAAAWLARTTGESLRPLDLTVHAGEDFVHLLGGLRRVAEAVELLELGEGARLGHAVALGVDVQAWCARAGVLHLPCGERLLDLLWAWRASAELPDERRTWLPLVEREVARLGKQLFGQPLDGPRLLDWWSALHDTQVLRRVGFPDGPAQGLGVAQHTTWHLVHAWLTSPEVFRRAQKLEPVDARHEAGMTLALQDSLRRTVAERSIVVEVNPSSNLLIGHLVDLTGHPLWRMAPPAGLEKGDMPIRIAIGSDDPITFATSLPEEFQLVSDALSRAGVPAPQVDQWLGQAQRCGLLARFTLPRSGRPLRRPTRFDPAPPLL